MGSMSLFHWMLVLGVIVLLFGAGRLPRVMGDMAKGIKAFKSGMREEETPVGEIPPKQPVDPNRS